MTQAPSNPGTGDASTMYFEESMSLWKNTLIRYLVPIETCITAVIVIAVLSQASGNTSGQLVIGLGVLGLCAFFPSFINMRTRVTDAGVHVRVMGFSRRMRFEDIRGFRVVKYDALGQFGGWGYRKSRKHGTAFTLAGEVGVRFDVEKGPVTVGTFRADELAEVLDAAGVPRSEE